MQPSVKKKANRIAVIFPNPFIGVDDKGLVREYDPDYRCDIFYYCESRENVKKINKKDMTLDIDKIKSEYNVILMVGAEVTKYVSNLMGGPQKLNAYAHQDDGVVMVSVIDPRKARLYPILGKKINEAFTVAVEALHAIEAGTPVKATFSKDYRILEDEGSILSALAVVEENKVLILDIETSALYPDKGYILGIGFGWKDHMGYYAPLAYWSPTALEKLKQLIYDPEVMVVCHNITFEMKWLYYHLKIDLFKWANYYDTMFLQYVYDENSPADLKTLAVRYTDLGPYEAELDEAKRVLARKQGIKLGDFSYANIPIEILGPYACKDIDATAQVFKRLYKYAKQFATVHNFLLYCAPAISQLELVGGPVDLPSVDVAIDQFDLVIADLEEELFSAPEVKELVKLQGKIFNPNSHQQVRRLLYEVAELPIIKRVDKDDNQSNPSTDAEVLEALEDQFPIARKLLEYRRAGKFRGTYLMNIKKKVSANARLVTGFNMARTSSGRLSSSGNINFQNIPRGPVVKQLFKARPGYKILQMDLGTAEVWVNYIMAQLKLAQLLERFILKDMLISSQGRRGLLRMVQRLTA